MNSEEHQFLKARVTDMYEIRMALPRPVAIITPTEAAFVDFPEDVDGFILKHVDPGCKAVTYRVDTPKKGINVEMSFDRFGAEEGKPVNPAAAALFEHCKNADVVPCGTVVVTGIRDEARAHLSPGDLILATTILAVAEIAWHVID